MIRLISLVKRYRTTSAVLVIAAMIGAAREADANASGATPVPAFKINGGAGGFSVDIPVPAGVLVHTVRGSRNRIDSQAAVYRANALSGAGLLFGRVCNWQIDFSYKRRGKEYMRERGKTIPECSGLVKSVQGRAKPKTLQLGDQTCAELWVDGKFRAAKCFSIVR